jgi:hypothetical protein
VASFRFAFACVFWRTLLLLSGVCDFMFASQGFVFGEVLCVLVACRFLEKERGKNGHG